MHKFDNKTKAHLEEQSSIAGGLDSQIDQTWREAYEQRLNTGIFGVGTQQVGTEDVFGKQRWTAVTGTQWYLFHASLKIQSLGQHLTN